MDGLLWGKDKDEGKYMCWDKYEFDGVLVGWGNMGSCLGQEQVSCPIRPTCGLTYHSLLGPDEGPVLTIHLVIQATGIAQVVTCPVPPPQWSSRCSTVHTLSGLW